MSLVNRTRAAKRTVIRIRNRLDDTIGTTIATLALHTSTSAETLVRTIVDLKVVPISATAVDHEYHMLIEREPGGQVQQTPSNSQELDAVARESLIWEDSGVYTLETVAGIVPPIHIKADLKSMRKMKPGDVTGMRHIGNLASTYTMKGTVTLFYKKG